MRLNDDEASGRAGLQRGEETMCQTAGGGGERGLSSGSFSYRNTISGTEELLSSSAKPTDRDVQQKTPESQVTMIM